MNFQHIFTLGKEEKQSSRRSAKVPTHNEIVIKEGMAAMLIPSISDRGSTVELQTFTPLMVQKSKTLAPYSPRVVLKIVLTQLPGVSERIGLQRSGS